MKPLILSLLLLASPLAANDEALKAWTARDYDAANKLLAAPLAAGEPAALYLRGRMAETGRGAAYSLADAVKFYQQAMDKGGMDGTAAIGRFTAAGQGGITKDEARGLALLRKAAEGGSTVAMNMLGELALAGADGEPDAKTALFWYQTSAKAKDGGGYLGMAALYDAGAAGLVKDDARGTALVLEAVQLGEPRAMLEMGLRYQTGRGVLRDNVAAMGWFHMAAQYALPEALLQLGMAYRTGNGCVRDFNRAGENFAAAARQHFAPAQFQIAQMFEAGEGTDAKPVYAYVNYHRAAAGGVKEAAERRDAVKAAFTPEQAAEAAKLLAEQP